MITWFLFAHQWTGNQILSVCFDASDQIIEPCILRELETLQSLQTNARTVVVLPGEVSSLHHVALPWLSEHKARAAIPYALEDHLAQNVTSLHFAFDRKHYQNHQYLVAVIDKLYLSHLIEQLEAFGLQVDVVTLDWFALNAGEACVTESSLLVHQEALNLNSAVESTASQNPTESSRNFYQFLTHRLGEMFSPKNDKNVSKLRRVSDACNDSTAECRFKGALSFELANLYLQSSRDLKELFVFSDSSKAIEYANPTLIETSSYEWIAGRLLRANGINFCQGEMKRGGAAQSSDRWFIGSVVLGLGALFSFIVMNLIQLSAINHKIDAVDQAIATIYREFFPQAKQVISPRFRINRLIQTKQASDQAAIWQLFSRLGAAFEAGEQKIISLQFQNRTVRLTFNSNDFTTLERFQQRLEQQGLTVKQTKALSEQKKVLATLELSL